MSRVRKSVDAESRLMVARIWGVGEGGGGLTVNGHGDPSGVMEMF